MAIQIIRLSDLVEASPSIDEANKILLSFKSIPHPLTGEVNDVEFFLHQKATLNDTSLLGDGSEKGAEKGQTFYKVVK